jgi:hypothetical protein
MKGRISSETAVWRTAALQVALSALFALLAACAGPVKTLYPPQSGDAPRTVYVINHGKLHTALAVKRSDIPKGTWPANRDYAGFKYLEVGWGDDDGYRKGLTVGIAARALIGSRRTVLLCDGFQALGEKLDSPGFTVVDVELSDRGFARLCQHVEQTYALDEAGRPIRLDKHWYRARGTYSAFNTCNTWIASGLRKAGCPINPGFCQTSASLLKQVRQFGRVVQSPVPQGRDDPKPSRPKR